MRTAIEKHLLEVLGQDLVMDLSVIQEVNEDDEPVSIIRLVYNDNLKQLEPIEMLDITQSLWELELASGGSSFPVIDFVRFSETSKVAAE